MKRILFFAIAGFLTLTACQNELKSEFNTKVIFTAQSEAGSRTILNNTNVLWQSTDAITLYTEEGESVVVTAKPYASGTCAKFEADVNLSDSYYAVYPYSAQSTFDQGRLTVQLPQSQSGTFADVNFAVAKSTADNLLYFKHIVGYIEFTIDKPGVVEISGSEGDAVVGDIRVIGFDGNNVPIYEVSNAKESVSVEVKASGTYYMAILPEAKLNTLWVTCEDGASYETAFSNNTLQMKRGKLVSLGNITDRFIPDGQFGATIEDFILEEFPYNF